MLKKQSSVLLLSRLSLASQSCLHVPLRFSLAAFCFDPSFPQVADCHAASTGDGRPCYPASREHWPWGTRVVSDPSNAGFSQAYSQLKSKSSGPFLSSSGLEKNNVHRNVSQLSCANIHCVRGSHPKTSKLLKCCH